MDSFTMERSILSELYSKGNSKKHEVYATSIESGLHYELK